MKSKGKGEGIVPEKNIGCPVFQSPWVQEVGRFGVVGRVGRVGRVGQMGRVGRGWGGRPAGAVKSEERKVERDGGGEGTPPACHCGSFQSRKFMQRMLVPVVKDLPSYTRVAWGWPSSHFRR